MIRFNLCLARVIEFAWLATAVLVPLLFNPWGTSAFELPQAALLKALALLLGLAALMRWTRASSRPARTPWLVLGLTMVFGLMLALATVLSVNARVSIFGTYERQQGLLTLVAYLVLFLVLACHLQTRAQVNRLWFVLVWTSLPIVLYGFIQVAGFDPFTWRTDAASHLLATLGRANFVGTYLVLVIPLTIPRVFASAHRWAYVLLVFLQMLALALTQARGAWIGFAVAAMTMTVLWATRWRNRRILFLSAAVSALVVVITIFVGAGLFHVDEGSTAARLTIWQTTIKLAVERPLFGYGPETMPIVFAPVFPPQLVYYQGRQVTVDRAHNVWLDLAASAGLAGVVSFLAMLIVLGRLAWRRWHGITEPWEHWLWIGIIASVAGHLSDVEFTFDVTATATIFVFVLALIVALARGATVVETALQSPRAPRNDRMTRFYLPALAIVVLLIVTLCVRPVLADVAYADSQETRQSITQRIAEGERAVALWSIEPTYHVQLAWLYLQAGRPRDVESELDAIAQLDPNHPRTWAVRGDIYMSWGQVDASRFADAERAYQHAVDLAPNVAGYHAALAGAMAQQKRWQDAAREGERAVALDATDPEAFRLLSELYDEVGNTAQAEWARKEAVRWSKR